MAGTEPAIRIPTAVIPIKRTATSFSSGPLHALARLPLDIELEFAGALRSAGIALELVTDLVLRKRQTDGFLDGLLVAVAGPVEHVEHDIRQLEDHVFEL